jgi:hypothetical protein
MTSGGNLNPANADMGALMGRMRRRCFTPTDSSIDVLGTSPLAPGEVALNATVPHDSTMAKVPPPVAMSRSSPS